MKLFIIIFFLAASFIAKPQCNNSLYSSADSSLKKYILTLTTSPFQGILVKDFIKMDSIRQYCNYSFFNKYPGRLDGLRLLYRGFFRVDIYISDCKNINRLNRKTWKINNIKDCKIKKIKIIDYDD
jgi:hypothetical protein